MQDLKPEDVLKLSDDYIMNIIQINLNQDNKIMIRNTFYDDVLSFTNKYRKSLKNVYNRKDEFKGELDDIERKIREEKLNLFFDSLLFSIENTNKTLRNKKLNEKQFSKYLTNNLNDIRENVAKQKFLDNLLQVYIIFYKTNVFEKYINDKYFWPLFQKIQLNMGKINEQQIMDELIYILDYTIEFREIEITIRKEADREYSRLKNKLRIVYGSKYTALIGNIEPYYEEIKEVGKGTIGDVFDGATGRFYTGWIFPVRKEEQLKYLVNDILKRPRIIQVNNKEIAVVCDINRHYDRDFRKIKGARIKTVYDETLNRQCKTWVSPANSIKKVKNIVERINKYRLRNQKIPQFPEDEEDEGENDYDGDIDMLLEIKLLTLYEVYNLPYSKMVEILGTFCNEENEEEGECYRKNRYNATLFYYVNGYLIEDAYYLKFPQFQKLYLSDKDDLLEMNEKEGFINLKGFDRFSLIKNIYNPLDELIELGKENKSNMLKLLEFNVIEEPYNEIFKILEENEFNIDETFKYAKENDREIFETLKQDLSTILKLIKIKNNKELYGRIFNIMETNNFDKDQALRYAISINDSEIYNILIQENVNLSDAFLESAKYGNLELVKKLWSKKGINYDLEKALEIALENDNVEVVKFLSSK